MTDRTFPHRCSVVYALPRYKAFVIVSLKVWIIVGKTKVRHRRHKYEFLVFGAQFLSIAIAHFRTLRKDP